MTLIPISDFLMTFGNFVFQVYGFFCNLKGLPALNSLDKVPKFSEGCFVSPYAQPVHVGHVSWFRGTYIGFFFVTIFNVYKDA